MKKDTRDSFIALLILLPFLLILLGVADDYQARDICTTDIGKPLSECLVDYVRDLRGE